MRKLKKKFMKKLYNRHMEILLSVLQLPSVYKIKNIKYLLILLLLIISSFILKFGIIYSIHFCLLQGLIFCLSFIFFCYLIFNFIIRIYNVFFRMFLYFRKKSNYIKIDKNIIIGYYVYNIISLILTIILLYNLANSLINYDDTFLKYIYIYIFLCTIISSIIYIAYISEEIIVVTPVKIRKFSFLFLLLNILLLSVAFIGVLNLSYFNFMVTNAHFFIKPFYYLGTESYSESVIETDTESESESESVIETDTERNSESDSEIETDTESDSESDTDTIKNEVRNKPTQENNNEQEQSTPLNQSKDNVQSDDSVVKTNEQLQTLNNTSSSSSRVKSEEIIRGRTMERRARHFGTTPSETSEEIRKEAYFRKKRLILIDILDKKNNR
jgi:hypothetical protein